MGGTLFVRALRGAQTGKNAGPAVRPDPYEQSDSFERPDPFERLAAHGPDRAGTEEEDSL